MLRFFFFFFSSPLHSHPHPLTSTLQQSGVALYEATSRDSNQLKSLVSSVFFNLLPVTALSRRCSRQQTRVKRVNRWRSFLGKKQNQKIHVQLQRWCSYYMHTFEKKNKTNREGLFFFIRVNLLELLHGARS